MHVGVGKVLLPCIINVLSSFLLLSTQHTTRTLVFLVTRSVCLWCVLTETEKLTEASPPPPRPFFSPLESLRLFQKERRRRRRDDDGRRFLRCLPVRFFQFHYYSPLGKHVTCKHYSVPTSLSPPLTSGTAQNLPN